MLPPKKPRIMLITFPKITQYTPDSGDGIWLPWRWRGLIFHYLRACDVWVEEKHSKVDYNPVYHFYDIIIFPCPSNLRDTAKSVAASAVVALKATGYKVEDIGPTHRWDDGKSVAGHRVWVRAR